MKPQSKNSWVMVILIASLAANAVWITRTILLSGHSSVKKESSDQRVRNLNLNPEQRGEIRRLMTEFRLVQMEYKQKILDKRMEIIEGLSDPYLDPKTLTKLVKALNDLENKLNQQYVNTLARLGTFLDSGQRVQLLLRLSRQWFFQPTRQNRGHDMRKP